MKIPPEQLCSTLRESFQKTAQAEAELAIRCMYMDWLSCCHPAPTATSPGRKYNCKHPFCS